MSEKTPLEQAQSDLESLHEKFIEVMKQRDDLVELVISIDDGDPDRDSGEVTDEAIELARKIKEGA